MSETDYNARLYEKMKAEQDKYRDWLVRQEPSEILEHTYEYIVVAFNDWNQNKLMTTKSGESA